jgi:hypothetical protein
MNIMRKLSLSSLFLILAGAAGAQMGAISGPVTGYVFDSSAHALRPVQGLPGAATIGPTIDAGYSLTAAYVSPRLDSFVGVDTDGAAHWFTIGSGAFNEKSISGLTAAPERVVFSPSGSTAALYAKGQAQIVTGLPASPSIAATIRLEAAPRLGRAAQRHVVPTVAVSDDGAFLLAAMDGAVKLASQNGVVRTAVPAGENAVMAFAPGGHDAAVAASGTGAMLITDVAGTAAQQLLTGDDPFFSALGGIAFSADGKKVFVASGSKQTVAAFDRAGNRSDLACSFSPSELTPMGTSFRLNELAGAPLWLVDAGPMGPRVVFVPALSAAQ